MANLFKLMILQNELSARGITQVSKVSEDSEFQELNLQTLQRIFGDNPSEQKELKIKYEKQGTQTEEPVAKININFSSRVIQIQKIINETGGVELNHFTEIVDNDFPLDFESVKKESILKTLENIGFADDPNKENQLEEGKHTYYLIIPGSKAQDDETLSALNNIIESFQPNMKNGAGKPMNKKEFNELINNSGSNPEFRIILKLRKKRSNRKRKSRKNRRRKSKHWHN